MHDKQSITWADEDSPLIRRQILICLLQIIGEGARPSQLQPTGADSEAEANRRYLQNQIQIAELMPEIPARDCFIV
jgi:hypothetical protein